VPIIEQMGEKRIEVVVMQRAVLYQGGAAHSEGALLVMRECDVRQFEEQGVVSRVPAPATRGPRFGRGVDSGIPLAMLFS
jgi:hypothetical protein